MMSLLYLCIVFFLICSSLDHLLLLHLTLQSHNKTELTVLVTD